MAADEASGSPDSSSADDGSAARTVVIPRLPPRRLRARIFGTLAALFLRVLDATWRKDMSELAEADRLSAAGERIIIAFWHGKYYPLFSILRGRDATIFASISLHGEMIAEICRWYGYGCVLLPDNGGVEARQTVIDAARASPWVGIAVDGPLGPYHVVKRGAIDLASEADSVIAPVSAACGRRWINRKRWDKREFPGPFSRLVLTAGKPMRVPRALDMKTRRALRNELRDTLEALDIRAEEKLRRLEGSGAVTPP